MLDIIHITSDLLGQVAHAATYQWEVPFPPAPGGGAPDTTIESVVNYVYTWGLALGGAFAFVRLVIAGIQWGTSGTVFAAGNAKQTMQEVGFGLVILLGSWLLLNTINPQIVNPSFNPPQLPAGSGDKGGMNNDSRTGGTQTTGGATGAVGNFTTNTAASLGFGTNSVGTSFIKMLESLPLGDVQDNTWTQAQAPSYGYLQEQRKTARPNVPQALSCTSIFTSYNRIQHQSGYSGTTKSQPNLKTEDISETPLPGAQPQLRCYSLPFKNTDCNPEGRIQDKVADLVNRWGSECVNAGSIISNLDNLVPQIIQYSIDYGMNPYMTLSLWIEESCAGANPKAFQLGCDNSYKTFGLKPPQAVEGMRGTPEELCKQLACLFTFRPDPKDFGSFMCGWKLGSDTGSSCVFPGDSTKNFPHDVGWVYQLLTKDEPRPECRIKFNAPGC